MCLRGFLFQFAQWWKWKCLLGFPAVAQRKILLLYMVFWGMGKIVARQRNDFVIESFEIPFVFLFWNCTKLIFVWKGGGEMSKVFFICRNIDCVSECERNKLFYKQFFCKGNAQVGCYVGRWVMMAFWWRWSRSDISWINAERNCYEKGFCLWLVSWEVLCSILCEYFSWSFGKGFLVCLWVTRLIIRNLRNKLYWWMYKNNLFK